MTRAVTVLHTSEVAPTEGFRSTRTCVQHTTRKELFSRSEKSKGTLTFAWENYEKCLGKFQLNFRNLD